MKPLARWIGICLFCVLPIVLFGIIRQKKQQREDRAFAWAEKYINFGKELPSRYQKMSHEASLVIEASAALQDIEEKLGVSARSRATIGYLNFITGNFQEANLYFQEASQLGPRDQLTINRLTEFVKYQKTAVSITPLLPSDYEINALTSAVIQQSTVWVVLCKHKKANKAKVFFIVLSSLGGKVLQEETIQDNRWVRQLYLRDLTGDSQPEVIVFQEQGDTGGARNCVQVFTWRNGNFVRIYNQLNQLSTWFEDLNHDGKYEIGSTIEIGSRLSHAGMPRWPSIYAYKNGRYILANNDFPQEFKNWSLKLRTLLQAHTNDYDLWHHLGKAYETQKQFKAALQSYQRAESLLKKESTKDSYYDSELASVRANLKFLRRRIRDSEFYTG